MMVLAESFQLPIVFGPSTAATGADVASDVASADGSALGSSVAIADSDAAGVGAGAASSLPLSGRVTTTTANKIIPTMIAASTLPEAPCLGAADGFVGADGAAALFVAGFGVDETSTRPAPRVDFAGTGGMTTEDAEVELFFAALFLTADFLAVAFFTVDFFTALFFAADFLATDFLAVVFLAAVFFTALFLTAAFLAADFFLTATITPCFGCT